LASLANWIFWRCPQFFLNVIGLLVCITPVFILRPIAWTLGWLFFLLARKRRQILLNNLSHVFSADKNRDEILKIAHISSRQLIELGMFALASPFFPRWRIRKNFRLEGNWDNFCERLRSKNSPQLLLIPHQTLTEALVFLPLLLQLEVDRLPLGIIYRPFKRKTIEQYVRRTRGRFGVRMLSRKGGLAEASHLIRKGGCVGLLFDQYAGGAGALTTLCGRVTSSTLLPEILCREDSVETFIVHTRRDDFWKASFVIEPIRANVDDLTDAINEWLEKHLYGDKIFRDSWLWAHNRWKRPVGEILNLHSRKQRLERSCKYYGYKYLPKNFRIFVRMPERIYATAMALPILRAICESRPDAHITTLCTLDHVAWLQSLPWFDEVLALPDSGWSHLCSAFQLRTRHPDLHISLSGSFRSAVEALFIGAPIRMGLQSAMHQIFPLLTHKSSPKKCLMKHPTLQWKEFFHHYGLLKNPSLEPIANAMNPQCSPHLAFCLGANGHGLNKFWSAEHWKFLATYLRQRNPNLKIILLGGDADGIRIAREIIGGVSGGNVANLTGSMPIADFAAKLMRCSAVIATDLDGMHLANAYGIPTVAIFGREPPEKYGPIYSGPHISLDKKALREDSMHIKIGEIISSFLEESTGADTLDAHTPDGISCKNRAMSEFGQSPMGPSFPK
jgi:ADP-heptose:LPS heptosyltransferase/lauroyl/myristoyl acyltransferase